MLPPNNVCNTDIDEQLCLASVHSQGMRDRSSIDYLMIAYKSLQAVQKPGVRMARLLGLRKGTLGSKYLQLYIAFTLSMLFHEWYNFNSVRREIGEFWFFMSQPFVITFEDFVQWSWRKTGHSNDNGKSLARFVGYIWTFAWFSYCLPPFVHGLLDTGIMGVDLGGPQAKMLGQEHVNAWVRI